MPKKHTKPVDNFNEDLLRYIMDSVYYPGEEELDGAGARPSLYAPLLKDAKTYREGRNRLIKKVIDDGNIDYLIPAIEAYNEDYGNSEAGVEYTPKSFDVSSIKKEPINIESMGISDVDAFADALANFLGYRNNGDDDKAGARKSLFENVYSKDNGFFGDVADSHGTKYDFYENERALANALRAKIEGSPSARREFYRTMGFTPETDIEDVLNVNSGAPAYATRSYRAYARKKDKPQKAISTIEGMLIAPQSAKRWDEGNTPTPVDVGADAIETLALSYLKGGKPLLSGFKGAGVVAGIDVLHDVIHDAATDNVYSGGEYPDVENGGFDDIMDPGRLGGLGVVALGRVPRGLGGVIKNKFGKQAKNGAEELAEVELRKKDIVQKLENLEQSWKEHNSLRKKAGMPLESKEEYRKGLHMELNEADIKGIESGRKNALFALFGNLAKGRTLYNQDSRRKSIDAMSEIYELAR